MYLRSYKELIVWQKSMELAISIYELTSRFPQTEIYGLVSQMRRAAVAIPSNIAEGYGRKSSKEYRQFLSIAYSSCLELETQLILAKKLRFVDVEDFKKSEALLQEVLKMLNTMMFKLKSKLISGY